jgi:hypothetical protein
MSGTRRADLQAALFSSVGLFIVPLACAAGSGEESSEAAIVRMERTCSAKVILCHIPPDNPTARHSIKVCEAAAQSHLAHGDSAGACPKECTTSSSCDDDDLCTADVCLTDGSCSHVPIVCTDGNACTFDTCSAATGCSYSPVSDGTSCGSLQVCDHGTCGAPSPCKPNMAFIGGAFCIDRYESSLDPVSGAAQSVPGVLPAAGISQVSASAACAQAGKRLCLDSEWLRTCGGPNMLAYPYGNTYQASACNGGETPHPEGSAAVTGSFPGCATAEGVLDMVGNLDEWTAAVSGTSRGGSFVEVLLNGQGCSYETRAHDVGFRSERVGFRCCDDHQ